MISSLIPEKKSSKQKKKKNIEDNIALFFLKIF